MNERREKVVKFAKFVACIVGLYLTVVVVIPAINRLPFFGGIQETVRKWDINCAAFFYTDQISTNEEVTKYTDL